MWYMLFSTGLSLLPIASTAQAAATHASAATPMTLINLLRCSAVVESMSPAE
eukprot:CAMPEP_0202831864 /NCGR_PEP_ID=MMETSP1389-20130828/17100_1 /ASSEMBLY_ACC=CAM_ASM_000865 /TAXON_ID=302021 /ORGANISM="Rhodomonas sp., Strain CCMP768" /LENGTH=51 /DNA_ID=CAMNT_0049505639 /DNA_START=240 /DNA_END=392 /DNA_ORIENTATION=-